MRETSADIKANKTLPGQDPKTQKPKLAPNYPAKIPWLGVVVPLLRDFPGFLQRATCYAGHLGSSRLSVGPNVDIYLFQDRSTIDEIWKKKTDVMCAGKVHVFACTCMFDMPKKTLALFAADNSGPFAQPYAGSNVEPKYRTHRMLSDGISDALTGTGFNPKMQRFRKFDMARVESLLSAEVEWTEIPDFHKFTHDTVGQALP